ncbi:hypothetical protein A2U01_0063456, partial [Trifolium medium]|nr:hypothetical protein [Trifolium medium]
VMGVTCDDGLTVIASGKTGSGFGEDDGCHAR